MAQVQADTLEAHNAHRALHGALPLQWSEECSQYAQAQADVCQRLGTLSHGARASRVCNAEK